MPILNKNKNASFKTLSYFLLATTATFASSQAFAHPPQNAPEEQNGVITSLPACAQSLPDVSDITRRLQELTNQLCSDESDAESTSADGGKTVAWKNPSDAEPVYATIGPKLHSAGNNTGIIFGGFWTEAQKETYLQGLEPTNNNQPKAPVAEDTVYEPLTHTPPPPKTPVAEDTVDQTPTTDFGYSSGSNSGTQVDTGTREPYAKTLSSKQPPKLPDPTTLPERFWQPNPAPKPVEQGLDWGNRPLTAEEKKYIQQRLAQNGGTTATGRPQTKLTDRQGRPQSFLQICFSSKTGHGNRHGQRSSALPCTTPKTGTQTNGNPFQMQPPVENLARFTENPYSGGTQSTFHSPYAINTPPNSERTQRPHSWVSASSASYRPNESVDSNGFPLNTSRQNGHGLSTIPEQYPSTNLNKNPAPPNPKCPLVPADSVQPTPNNRVTMTGPQGETIVGEWKDILGSLVFVPTPINSQNSGWIARRLKHGPTKHEDGAYTRHSTGYGAV